ncbi:MAG: LiaF-related protein [Corynebacterium sp.]|uniref:DUF1707 SHOCT-like domain-containing protein n=1 Tax=Corynebacterium sp. TaxID=1720 RepID=UPI0026DC1D0F|nr:LiaF domain-containing protein [Corynebacterium sp.]MDO4762189.1 LiaF-related protein [Corynebacterium sp.]
MESQQPKIRVSSFHRNCVAHALKFALDDGQLDFMEYTTRNNQAMHAVYREELQPLLADLDFGPSMPHAQEPGYWDAVTARFHSPIMPEQLHNADLLPRADMTPYSSENSVASQRNFLLPATHGGVGNSISFFSSNKRVGSWVCAPEHTALCIFGSTKLDFTKAQVTSTRTTVMVNNIFGEVVIIVPEHCEVEDNVQAIFGEVSRKDRRKHSQHTDVSQGAPVISIEGLCLFGSVVIKRVSTKS